MVNLVNLEGVCDHDGIHKGRLAATALCHEVEVRTGSIKIFLPECRVVQIAVPQTLLW